MTNWTKIINEVGVSNFKSFIAEDLSRDQFYDLCKGTEISGQVRGLLRGRGVKGTRQLAKQALARR